MINKNTMKLDNKNLMSIYNRNKNANQNKENKTNSNKTVILKNIKNKKDSLAENNKITYTENCEVNGHQSINRDNYNKKLIENFQHEMESQRVAKKKTRTKIFLPPLICLSPGKFNLPINLRTEAGRNLKSKKSLISGNKNTENLLRNSSNENVNLSLLINNSFSGNSRKMIIDNDETINSNNENKIKSNKFE